MKSLNIKAALIMVLGMSLIGVSIAQPQERKAVRSPGDHSGHVMLTPGELEWVDGPPMLPSSAKMALIEGDLKSHGPFTMRLKFPANYKIPPHWHPAQVHVTVLSGTFNMGLGSKLNPEKGKALPVGSIAVMPAKLHHFGWASEETIIQMHGVGPLGVNYVNPADHPKRSK